MFHMIRCPIMNICFYNMTGTFTEKFELINFPFDVQDLQISLECTDSEEVALFVPTQIQFKGDFSGFFKLEYSALQEYTVHPPFLEYYVSNDFVKQGQMNIRLKLERNYGIYFWSIYLMAFCTTVATLFAFSMDPVDDLTDRIGHVVTLLLTAVAFQFVISTEMPKLPYSTLLDEYITASFTYLLFVMFLVALVPLFGDRYEYDATDKQDSIKRADRICMFVAIGCIVIAHFVYFVRVWMRRKEERVKINLDKWGYERWEKERGIRDDNLTKIDFKTSTNVGMDPMIWDRIEAEDYKDIKRD